MRVLITGANGQLGGALQRLAPTWAEINAIDIEDCDLVDRPMLSARLTVEAPDVIINAAAYTAVDSAESNEDCAREVNADAVAAMVEAMAEAGGRVVHVSSDLVFDGRLPRPYLPSDTRNPLSAYGRTKAEGEDALRPDDLLVRTARLYEAGGANFVRTMIRSMQEHEEVSVVADQVGSPTWASGLARTIWGLVKHKATGAFHHSDAGSASWYNFAVAIGEESYALGLLAHLPVIHPVSSLASPAPARRPAKVLLDCGATLAALGQNPVHWRTNLSLMLQDEVRLL